jgi:Contractile injection system tape measure protein
MKQKHFHTIKHVTLDLQSDGFTPALELQQEANEWVYNLMHQVDDAFSNISSDERVVIDELILDVSLDAANWKEEATQQILKQLQDKLKNVSKQIASTSPKEKLQQQQSQIQEEFLFYLKHGFLPWNTTVTSIKELEAKLIEMQWMENSDFTELLLSLLQRSAWSSTRLVQQFSAKLIKIILAQTVKLKDADPLLAADVQQLLNNETMVELLKQTQGFLFPRLLELIVLKNAGEYKGQQLQKMLVQFAASHPSLAAQWEMIHFEAALFTQIQTKLHQQKEQVKNPLLNNKQDEQIAKQKFNFQDKETAGDEPAVSADAIYISNAGLVIAAAFMPALFNRLGIVKDNIITNIDFAVCITQYLSKSNQEMEEYELVLPKILCGLHPSFPVNTKNFFITNEIEGEVNGMLASIIEHWSVLKDTSVKGLQESFLMRDGKLVFHKNRWQLTAEQKSYDMLLKQLPWNISMLQLPWMKQLLVTEWVY